MPLNFGGGNSTSSSSVNIQQIRQQLQPYFIDQTGDTINASSDIISSVPNPVNAQDPVNLQYLNANSVSIASGNTNYLRLDGTNNPTATISLNNNRITNLGYPSNGLDAVSLNYISTLVTNSLMKVDGTAVPTANIQLGNFRLINVGDPVNLQDAVTKNWTNNNLPTSTSFTRSLYEPDIIRTQNPYFHFCADAYSNTEASIVDFSANSQPVTFTNFPGVPGTTTISSNLNDHKYTSQPVVEYFHEPVG